MANDLPKHIFVKSTTEADEYFVYRKVSKFKKSEAAVPSVALTDLTSAFAADTLTLTATDADSVPTGDARTKSFVAAQTGKK